MTRYDAVNYISHGIAKRPGASETRPPRGAEEEQPGSQGGEPRGGRQEEAAAGRADGLLRQPQQQGQGRQDRSADRPRGRDQPHHPGAVPPLQEQPALCRRSRRRQDGDRRRPGQAHRRRRRAGSAVQRHHLRARHGHAACRHALSRRFRGAAEAGREGARGLSGRDPVHRRDPHGDRRRRHLGRRHGCLQPAEAGAVVRRHPLHRLDHLQGVPPVLREGPRAGAALPEDRRQRADDRRRHRDHEGPQALFRGVPQGPLHQRGDQGGGRAFGALHQRPQAAGQGDRRDRRDRRLADAAAGGQAQEDDRHQGDRGDDRDDGAHPAEDGFGRATSRCLPVSRPS